MSYSIIFSGNSLHKLIDWNRLKLNAGGRISKFFIEKKIFYSLQFNHSPIGLSLHWFLFLIPPETPVHCLKNSFLSFVILFFSFFKNQ